MMPYQPVLATLGYVLSPDHQNVLLVYRNARKSDHHYGKYNGLGGKMESNEDVITCMQREIREEAGIECTVMKLRGTINWTGFSSTSDWFGFIFLIERFAGIPYKQNDKGLLEWILLDIINELPMWEGDRYFLPLVFDSNPLNWTFIRQ